eukprot:COSAG02_NODE_402_length_23060_cov_58.831105_4_plen_97_part_00
MGREEEEGALEVADRCWHLCRVVRIGSLRACPSAIRDSLRGRREGAQAILVRHEAPMHWRDRPCPVVHVLGVGSSDCCRHLFRVVRIGSLGVGCCG